MGSITAAVAASAINCWAAAGVRYDLPVDLLFAIGQVESGHRVDARGNNKDGSRDLGVMQINSRWLPLLAEYRISEQDLLTNPCTNIQVGAWILAQEVQRTGYSWESIGAYNAGPLAASASPEARARKLTRYRAYASMVIQRWRSLEDQRAKGRLVRTSDAIR